MGFRRTGFDHHERNRRARDTRVVYGAVCTWWDSIRKAVETPSGLPGCPHCGGVLMEIENELVWWTNVDEHVVKTGDKYYRGFMEWLRGRQCFTTAAEARLEYMCWLAAQPMPKKEAT